MADTKGTKQNAKIKAAQKTKSNKASIWAEDHERLILYADIMGFKEFVRTHPHEEVKERLLKFKNYSKDGFSDWINNENIKFVQYSDSILIVENEVNENGLNRISFAAQMLADITMDLGFGLNGCIAYGMLTFDKENELYFGQPLIDAYLLQQEIHYYGIVVHHSAESIIKEYNYALPSDPKIGNYPYIYSPIPLKKGLITHCHLALNLLPAQDQNSLNIDFTKQYEEKLENIETTVSGAPRIYIDNTRKVMRNDNNIFKKAQKKKINSVSYQAELVMEKRRIKEDIEKAEKKEAIAKKEAKKAESKKKEKVKEQAKKEEIAEKKSQEKISAANKGFVFFPIRED
ncbi:hypothetical protein [Porphyromonas gulae]|uniref:hypothetical protein n=1 Tax=Porphyromonas gulae TaxID=111105 RepID=UPI000689938C|nr:hypothetical protein [Porphyromonas gulae]